MQFFKEYPWNMTVTYDGDTYNVTNLAAEKVDALLDEIYSGEPAESYTLNMDGLEEAAAGGGGKLRGQME